MAIFTGRIRPSQRSTSYVEAQADGVFKNNCLSKEEQTTIDSEDWRQSSKVFFGVSMPYDYRSGQKISCTTAKCYVKGSDFCDENTKPG